MPSCPSEKIEASPVALLSQSKAQQKSFLFLLPARRSLSAGGEEKIRRAQNEKGKEYFSVVWRAKQAVVGLASLVPFKKGSRIFKQRAPNWTSRFFGSQSDKMFAVPVGEGAFPCFSP